MTRRRSSAGEREERAERPEPRERDRPQRRSADAAGIKIPLPDQVNEIVVISAALVDHETRAKLVKLVHPDSFYGKGHPEIWAVICELERRGLGYDAATVKQLSGGAVDTDYLDALLRDRPAIPPNLMHHVDVLRWDHQRVEALRGPTTEFLEAVRGPNADPDRIRKLARGVAQAFEGTGPLPYLRDPAVLAEIQIADIRARKAGRACFPFGIDGLDVYRDGPLEGEWRMIPGTKPGQVSMLTGVSRGGKTTTAARIALAQEAAGRKVLYAAWEQGSGMTLELLAGMQLMLPRGRVMIGGLSEEEIEQLRAEMIRLREMVRFFALPFDRHKGEKGRTNEHALDAIQEYVEAWGAGGGLVILDLFAKALVDQRPEKEDHALQRLQAMAQETNAHFMIIHQQRSKDVMLRADPQPTLEGMKGSSAWFDVPDTIIGVHREYLYKAVPDDVLRLLILKQRYGVSEIAVDFDWNASLGSITNGRSIDGVRPGSAVGEVDEFLAGGAGKWKPGDGKKKPGGRKRDGQR